MAFRQARRALTALALVGTAGLGAATLAPPVVSAAPAAGGEATTDRLVVNGKVACDASVPGWNVTWVITNATDRDARIDASSSLAPKIDGIAPGQVISRRSDGPGVAIGRQLVSVEHRDASLGLIYRFVSAAGVATAQVSSSATLTFPTDTACPVPAPGEENGDADVGGDEPAEAGAAPAAAAPAPAAPDAAPANAAPAEPAGRADGLPVTGPIARVLALVGGALVALGVTVVAGLRWWTRRRRVRFVS